MQTPAGKQQPKLIGYIAIVIWVIATIGIFWFLFTFRPDFVITASCMVIASFAFTIYLIQQRKWLYLALPVSILVGGIGVILDRTILPGSFAIAIPIAMVVCTFGLILSILENKKHKLS